MTDQQPETVLVEAPEVRRARRVLKVYKAMLDQVRSLAGNEQTGLAAREQTGLATSINVAVELTKLACNDLYDEDDPFGAA